MTQSDLGKKINVTKSAVSGYETGIRTPDSETLKKIATLFNVSTDYLLGRSDEKNPASQGYNSEFEAFKNNPQLSAFWRELPESEEEQVQELYEMWKIISKRNQDK
ncbi:transcriptional regulator [Listeria fleischmannii FSL S10-1203]|uniref:Transcriptional regulator n=1 Tax=Listeria fleischmannii FSL S10-1203 TaxID=1265822 RepID=W7DY37_9LIST|nr:transcriptional regulator [Listeria fleischmannii FSL S10-1203]